MGLAEDYLDFMICILEADGAIKEEEKTFFLRTLDQLSLQSKLKQKYKSMLAGKMPSLDADKTISRIAKKLDYKALAWLVRDGFLFADSDGEIRSSEMKIIYKLLEKADIPKSRNKKIIDWGKEFINHTKQIDKLFEPRRC